VTRPGEERRLERAFSGGLCIGPPRFGGGAQFGPGGGIEALLGLNAFFGGRGIGFAAVFGPTRLGGRSDAGATGGGHVALARLAGGGGNFRRDLGRTSDFPRRADGVELRLKLLNLPANFNHAHQLSYSKILDI